MYLKSKIAKLTFDQEDFDCNAFIYTFELVKVDDNIVLLAINNFGMNNSYKLSFQVILSKTDLKKESFVKMFMAKYESAFTNIKIFFFHFNS